MEEEFAFRLVLIPFREEVFNCKYGHKAGLSSEMVARNSSWKRGRQLQGRGTEQKSQWLQPSTYSDSKGYNSFPRHPQL